jgi:cytochrome P450
MLSVKDFLRPIEWGKSFVGDGLPPGPYGGDLYTGIKFASDWANGNIEVLMEAYEEFGPVFTTRTMGHKIVWLIGAEANQTMYVKNWRDFYWWGSAVQGHLAGLIGEGLLASVDEKHDKARKLLDPVFSKENLKKYVYDMIELTEEKVQELDDGARFDFYEWAYDIALLNATNCFMGMDTDGTDIRTLHENFDTTVEYFQKPIHLQILRGPGTPHWYFKQAKQELDNVLFEEIEKRRQTGTRDNDNILDRLLQAEEDGETFTNQEIHDQILNLYWAGHDTTISAMSWFMVLLGKHPKVYENLLEEIDERVGDEPITAEEVLDGLPYLEMVMDEVLRLYPPAWIAFRKTRKNFTMYDHEIPEGIDVAFSSYVTHRLPHLYEQPEAFKPRRMEPEKKRDFPSGAYIPFARGPRTCIGMNFAKYELKLVIATLLRHFDYELLPGQSYQAYPVATLTPDQVRIQLSRRENGSTLMSGDGRQNAVPIQSEEFPDNSTTEECPVH